MAFEDLSILRACDLGYFIFNRQQGMKRPVSADSVWRAFVLSQRNPFWQDLAFNLPVLLQRISTKTRLVREAQRPADAAVDKPDDRLL